MYTGVGPLACEATLKKKNILTLSWWLKKNVSILLVWFEVGTEPLELVVIEENFEFAYEAFAIDES